MAKKKRKRKAKSTGHVHSCAVTLGRRGGQATARKKKRKSGKRRAKKSARGQLSLF